MVVAGIDPGLNGGLAFLGHSGNPFRLEVMPTVANLLDLQAIRAMFGECDPEHVYVERATAMPKQGSVSMFKFGRVFGALEGLLVGLGVPYTVVPPKAWQKVMHAGVEASLSPKERSLVAVQRFYPDLNLKRSPRCKVAHDGMVDALLIARWGWGGNR